MIHIIFIILQFILKIKRKLTLAGEKDISLFIWRLLYINVFNVMIVQATATEAVVKAPLIVEENIFRENNIHPWNISTNACCA